MSEWIEKHKVKYHCGCIKEMGLGVGGGFWKPTGDNEYCGQHKEDIK